MCKFKIMVYYYVSSNPLQKCRNSKRPMRIGDSRRVFYLLEHERDLTCPRAGWISMLLSESLQNAVSPPGPGTLTGDSWIVRIV